MSLGIFPMYTETGSASGVAGGAEIDTGAAAGTGPRGGIGGYMGGRGMKPGGGAMPIGGINGMPVRTARCCASHYMVKQSTHMPKKQTDFKTTRRGMENRRPKQKLGLQF
jgi:hypothetical protein